MQCVCVCVCVWVGWGWGVVQVVSKSSLKSVLEKFYIYKETRMNNQINDRDRGRIEQNF